MKYDWDHHRDLFAGSGLDQRPLGRPHVGRLGCQHIDQGGAALDGNREAFGEPGHNRETAALGECVQRLGDRDTGAGLCQDDGQLIGERSATAGHDPVEGGDGAFACRHRQGEQVSHGGELGEDALLALPHTPGEGAVSYKHRDDRGAQADEEPWQRPVRCTRGPEQPDDQGGASTTQPPAHLRQPELFDRHRRTGSLQPAADRVPPAEDRLQSHGARLEHRPGQRHQGRRRAI